MLIATGALLLGSAAGTPAQAQRIVTPGDGTWNADTRAPSGSNGTADITGSQPRLGNGSLELSTTGSLLDWGWYTLFAGDPFDAGWGLLSSINRLSFDWFRESSTPTADPVWEAQSIVFRLFVRAGSTDAPIFSELVWESYYNGAGDAPRDSWISQDLTNQLFWRSVTGEGYTIGGCSSPATITPGIPLKLETLADWANGDHCYQPQDAVVYGIGIGVGSAWPHDFRGYADNVQLGFTGSDQLTVHDNFEQASTVTPEPATLVLLGTGLAGIGGVARRRKARSGGSAA